MKKLALGIILIASFFVGSAQQKVVKISGGITPVQLNDSLALYLKSAFAATIYKPLSYFPTWSEITGTAPFVLISDTTGMLTAYRHWLFNYLTQTAGDARYPQLSGAYSNPSWITGLAPSKILQSGATVGQVLKWNGSAWVPDTDAGVGGGITSIGLSVPTGFLPVNSPLTANGTFGFSFASGYSLPTTQRQINWDSCYFRITALDDSTGLVFWAFNGDKDTVKYSFGVAAVPTTTLTGDVTGVGAGTVPSIVTWANGYTNYDARYARLGFNNAFTGNNTHSGTNAFSNVSTFTGNVNLNANTFIPALTEGQIVYAGASGQLVGNSNLFWNNTLKRIGIGTTSPNTSLHILDNNPRITLESPGTVGAEIRFSYSGTVRGYMFHEYIPASGVNSFSIGDGAGANLFRIGAGGNLAIGGEPPGLAYPNNKYRFTIGTFNNVETDSAFLMFGKIGGVGGSAGTPLFGIRENGETFFGNDSARRASAILALNTTTKGFLPPRVTGVQMAAITSPANGLVVYNTDSSGLCFYVTGTGWLKIGSSSGTGAISSVFGRTGTVVAVGTDYSSFYPSLSGSYDDPSWIIGLDWNKLNNIPTTFAPSSHNHSGSEITSGTIADSRLSANVVKSASENSSTVISNILVKGRVSAPVLFEGIDEAITILPTFDYYDVSVDLGNIPTPTSIPVTTSGTFFNGQKVTIQFQLQGATGLTLAWDAGDFGVEANGDLELPTSYPGLGATYSFIYKADRGLLILIGSSDQKSDPIASTSTAGYISTDDYRKLFTYQSSANPTGTITHNGNSGSRHSITFTGSGGRTLAFSNISAGYLVTFYFDNTSGGAITLTLPSNGFVQNTSGVYASAASVSIPVGKTTISLNLYDGTNFWYTTSF